MQLKKLKDTCIIKPPKKEAKDLLTESDLVSFVPMSDLGIDQKFLHLNEEKELKKVYSGYTYFKDDDVLLAKITPCFENGKLGIAKKLKNGIGFGSSEYIVYRPKNKEELNSEYLYYFLNQESFREFGASRMAGAVGHKRIQKDFYEEYLIPIISIERQKQIVEILDKAFEAIDKAKENIEKNIQNSKELFQSKLNEIFSQKGEGWEEKTLKEVCSIITDGTHQTPKYFDSGYTFLSSKNVTSGVIDWDNIKYIDKEQHIQMQKRVSPQLNDVLLAKNGTTGVAAIVDREVDFDIYVSLALLRATEKLKPRYLLHFVNSSTAKAQFNKRLKGVGVPNLHLKEIREVIINYPIDKNEQKKIVEYIDDLTYIRNGLVDNYQQKLENLKELKKSILQKAFSGQLV